MGNTRSFRKQFVVLFGPAGSGKTRAAEIFMNQEHRVECKSLNKVCLEAANYFYAGVDTYVEQDPEYIHRMKEYQALATDLVQRSLSLEKCSNPLELHSLRVNLCTQTIEQMVTIQGQMNAIAQDMTNIYFDVRNKKNYNISNENSIVEKIKEGFNIIFEITGQNTGTIDKICHDSLFSANQVNLKKLGYVISVVVSYTSYTQLRDRLLRRYLTQAADAQGSPRLTPVEDKQLHSNEKDSFDNLATLITNKCVARVVVYDNNADGPVRYLTIIISSKGSKCIINRKLKMSHLKFISPSFLELVKNTCS